MDFIKTAGVALNVVVSSEREDWIFEFIKEGLGVSVAPESSAQSDSISQKPVSELDNKRVVELVMTTQAASNTPALTIFYQAAQEFDWSAETISH